jgi:heme-degrading monooxygenase HmoA
MPVPPHREHAAGFEIPAFPAALSMPASIALACLPEGRKSSRIHAGSMQEISGKVEMYVIIWKFEVHPGKVDAFVAAYKGDGAWAQLFAEAEGFIGTELLRSVDIDNRAEFVTIDRWQSSEDFARFRAQFDTLYRTLDTQWEGMTLNERKLGTFVNQG